MDAFVNGRLRSQTPVRDSVGFRYLFFFCLHCDIVEIGLGK